MNKSCPIVCFLSVVHPLQDHRFYYKEAPALAAGGWNVILAFPSQKSVEHPQFRIYPLKPPVSRWRRFLYAIAILPEILKLRADIYHLVDVELLPLGFLLKILGKKVIYDAHEDTASFMMHKTYLPKPIQSIMAVVIRNIENLADRCFDGLVLADPGTSDLHSFMPNSRKLIYYNYPLRANFPKKNDLPSPTHRRYDFCFLGTMTETSGAFVLLESLAILKQQDRNFKCLFIGQPDTQTMSRITAFLESHSLENSIEITGRIPHGDVPQRLMDCRIGLIGLLDLPKFRRNIPTKLFEYWACGLPVVAPDLPPTRPVFDIQRHGCLFQPGNAYDAAEKIAMLMDCPHKVERMSQACRDDFESIYYGELQQEKLRNFYMTHFVSGSKNEATDHQCG